MPKMSGFPNKSGFVIAVPPSFLIPPLIRSIKMLLFGNPDILNFGDHLTYPISMVVYLNTV
jgi:hypothetical protein